MNDNTRKIFIAAVLILSFTAFAAAQDAPAPNADEVQRTQLVNALERAQTEVKASRRLIDAMKDEIRAKESRIDALDKKDSLSAKAISGLQSEIVNLRAAVGEAESALGIRKKEVAELKKDLDKTRRKLHRARELVKILAISAGILSAITLLK